MAIDASIYNNVRTYQMDDPVNKLAQILQAQNAMQSNKLNDLKLAETERGIEEGNKLRALLGQAGFDFSKPENRAAMYAISPAQAQAYEKSQSELAKSNAAADKDRTDALKTRTALYRDALAGVNSPQDAVAYVTSIYNDPAFKGTHITAEPLDAKLARIPQDAAGFNNWKQQMALGATKFIEQNAPKTSVVDTGGQQQIVQTPGLGGAPTVAGVLNKTVSPDDVLKANVTMRGQNMTDARQKEKNQNEKDAVGKVEWKQDTDGNWVALPKEIKDNGPVTPVTTTVPGKRSVQAGHAIDIIQEARGLIDGSTNSYLGTGVDQAARAIGVATPGAQNNAKLKALEGALMMAQPRMEGPQSDKDVALYRQMAGQIGDPTVPAGNKKAALDAIEALHQKYVNPQSVNQNTQQKSAAPKSGHVEGGYRFKGGNPADPKNWEKL